MSFPISPSLAPIAPLAPAIAAKTAGPGNFQDILSSAVATVEQKRADAQTEIQKFLSGDGEDIHKVAIATQRAEVASELFLQVRSKVVSAYQEIMRMQM